jgi:hypothetical protein
MTYGHVYKSQRTETFDQELARMRGIHAWYKSELEKAKEITTVPSQIASHEGTVDAYATMIHGLERMREC